jgi:hypothetical protein
MVHLGHPFLIPYSGSLYISFAGFTPNKGWNKFLQYYF